MALVTAALHRVLGSAVGARAAFVGLDVSTRAVGIGIVGGTAGELVHSEVLTVRGHETPLSLGAAVGARVHELVTGLTDHTVVHVVVEDALKSFATGRFRTQGLFKLARLNAIVGFDCWRRLPGVTVAHVPPLAIRAFFETRHWPPLAEAGAGESPSAAGLAAPAGDMDDTAEESGEESSKAKAAAFVAAAHEDLAQTWSYAPRSGAFAKTNFDRTDALLAAMFAQAQWLEWTLLRGVGGDSGGAVAADAQAASFAALMSAYSADIVTRRLVSHADLWGADAGEPSRKLVTVPEGGATLAPTAQLAAAWRKLIAGRGDLSAASAPSDATVEAMRRGDVDAAAGAWHDVWDTSPAWAALLAVHSSTTAVERKELGEELHRGDGDAEVRPSEGNIETGTVVGVAARRTRGRAAAERALQGAAALVYEDWRAWLHKQVRWAVIAAPPDAEVGASRSRRGRQGDGKESAAVDAGRVAWPLPRWHVKPPLRR